MLLVDFGLCDRKASQHNETVILTIIASETLNESLWQFPIGAKYCIACTKLAVRNIKSITYTS